MRDHSRQGGFPPRIPKLPPLVEIQAILSKCQMSEATESFWSVSVGQRSRQSRQFVQTSDERRKRIVLEHRASGQRVGA